MAAVIVADRVEAVGEIVTKLGTSPGARQRGAEEPTPVFLALLLVFGPGMCTRNAARVGESFGGIAAGGTPTLTRQGRFASFQRVNCRPFPLVTKRGPPCEGASFQARDPVA